MTEEQQRHAYSLTVKFSELMLKKYDAGVKEHGGNLWEVAPGTVLDYAIDEAIDQVVYLLTLKEQLNGEAHNIRNTND